MTTRDKTKDTVRVELCIRTVLSGSSLSKVDSREEITITNDPKKLWLEIILLELVPWYLTAVTKHYILLEAELPREVWDALEILNDSSLKISKEQFTEWLHKDIIEIIKELNLIKLSKMLSKDNLVDNIEPNN